jgi:hypothetical protein
MSLRDVWRDVKKRNKADFDHEKIADKRHFGPALDKYETALKAYHTLEHKLRMNPDPAKSRAAKDKVIAAARVAVTASVEYLVSLKWFSQNTAGASGAAATDLYNTLSSEILPDVVKAANGEMPEL